MASEETRKRKFRSIQGVKQFVGRVLRALEDSNRSHDPEVASAMFRGAKLMSELIRDVSMEQRVKALEERLPAEPAPH